jgi:hypothetical protein
LLLRLLILAAVDRAPVVIEGAGDADNRGEHYPFSRGYSYNALPPAYALRELSRGGSCRRIRKSDVAVFTRLRRHFPLNVVTSQYWFFCTFPSPLRALIKKTGYYRFIFAVPLKTENKRTMPGLSVEASRQ